VLNNCLHTVHHQVNLMYERILVPIDGSETSARGLEEAMKVAKDGQGGRIRLVHVVNEFIFDGAYSSGTFSNDLFASLRDTGKSILAESEALVRRHGIEVDSVMLESIGAPAADFIVAQARQWPADLIVMGTHGRRGLARLAMGSDAEFVIRMASVPVLLVRKIPQRAGAAPELAPAAGIS
jgi:nucleotide-binding universal stress UspA family protein